VKRESLKVTFEEKICLVRALGIRLLGGFTDRYVRNIQIILFCNTCQFLTFEKLKLRVVFINNGNKYISQKNLKNKC